MKPLRAASTAVATVATAGISTLFFGAMPAMGAPTEACGPTGTLIGPGICEQEFTGPGTFLLTSHMTTLEMLLVGPGGAGIVEPGSTGYAYAGGGGEVRIVDLTGSSDPINVEVGTALTSITDGVRTETAASGSSGSVGGSGSSGSGHLGGHVAAAESPSYGGGGGAGSAGSAADGGAGVVAGAIAPAGSLFTGDARCFGGGGAAGINGVQGIPGCGGGGPLDTTGASVSEPTTHSGGGGAATPAAATLGARGIVIARWTAAPVTVQFNVNGYGSAPAAQSVLAGNSVTEPTAPTAEGYEFLGWFTDAALTTAVDFASPVTESATYFASWAEVLAETGAEPRTSLVLGLTALLAGAGLAAFAYRRRDPQDG